MNEMPHKIKTAVVCFCICVIVLKSLYNVVIESTRTFTTKKSSAKYKKIIYYCLFYFVFFLKNLHFLFFFIFDIPNFRSFEILTKTQNSFMDLGNRKIKQPPEKLEFYDGACMFLAFFDHYVFVNQFKLARQIT